MDFQPTARQQEIQSIARTYAEDVIAPRAADIERAGTVPEELLKGLGERGLMGVNISPELSGTGAGVVAYSLAMTEIAKACASTAVTMAVTNMVGEVLEAFGSEEQRRRYNPELCAGRTGAFALSEAGAGSDPGGMRTTARRDGDGWVLNGTKQWISHGDVSRVLVVWARTGGEGPRGLSCFLVDGGAEGLIVEKHEDKMGLRGSHTCGLAFEDVRLSGDALLGQEGGGFRVAMMALDGGRVGIGSQALGIGEAAHARAVERVRALGRAGWEEAQGLSFRLADSRTELDAARLLTLRAARLKEAGRPFSQEASMAKLFASEAAWRVCHRALDVVAGTPGGPDRDVERWMRDVRVTRIYEGTSEVQRLVISRTLLRAG